MLRANRLLTVLLLAAFSAGGSRADEPTAESCLGIKDDPNSPVAINLALTSCDLKDGLCLRAEISNKGAEPHTLQVCPQTYLCCVKDLHLLVGFDGTGMGLLDICKQPTNTPHEVFLPPQSSFAYTMRIPPDRLPHAAMAADKKLTLLLCYAMGKGRLVHSNAVQANVK